MEDIGKRGRSGGSGSHASSATNLEPNLIRLVRLVNAPFIDMLIGIIVIGIGVGIYFRSNLTVVLIAVGISLLSIFFLIRLAKATIAENASDFTDGLLTAGIVNPEESDQIEIITIASIGQGAISPGKVFGIKKILLVSYPGPLILKPGDRIPLASVFFRDLDKDPPYWVYYRSIPIAFGTGKKEVLEKCLQVISDDDEGYDPFEILTRYLEKNQTGELNEMYVCDENGDALSLEEVMDRRPRYT